MTSRRLLDPTAKALFDAADLIERGGHCKGAFFRGGAHCALGALREVALIDRAEEAASRLFRHIGHQFIPHWNDAPERTAADVIAALRAAAIADPGS